MIEENRIMRIGLCQPGALCYITLIPKTGCVDRNRQSPESHSRGGSIQGWLRDLSPAGDCSLLSGKRNNGVEHTQFRSVGDANEKGDWPRYSVCDRSRWVCRRITCPRFAQVWVGPIQGYSRQFYVTLLSLENMITDQLKTTTGWTQITVW